MKHYIGLMIPGVRYAVFEDARDGFHFLVPDVTRFSAEEISSVKRHLKTCGFPSYTNWKTYVRIQRQTVAQFCTLVGEHVAPGVARDPGTDTLRTPSSLPAQEPRGRPTPDGADRVLDGRTWDELPTTASADRVGVQHGH